MTSETRKVRARMGGRAVAAGILLAMLAGSSIALAQSPVPRTSGIARVGDFFDLGGIYDSLSDQAPQDAAATGSGQNTLDVLHGDVVAYSDKLCKQLETASQDEIDVLDKEYEGLRREQLEELDRIAREEKELDRLRRALDAGGGSNGSAGSLAATRKALEAVRRDISHIETLRKELQSTNELLIGRRQAFDSGRAALDAAEAEIERLTEAKRRVLDGDVDEDLLGGLGAGQARHNLELELQRRIDNETLKRDAALVEIGDALQIHPLPKSHDDLFDPQTGGLKGDLYRSWQTYRTELGGLEARLTEAKAKEASTLATLAELERVRPGADGPGATPEEYRARVAAWVGARTAALLTFQLHQNVTDCIRRRAAELGGEDGPTVADITETQNIVGHITETCYGPTDAESHTLDSGYTYHTHYWNRFDLVIDPEGRLHLKSSTGPLGWGFDDPDAFAALTRGRLEANGSFAIDYQGAPPDPSLRTEYHLHRETGPEQFAIETNLPYRLEGRLVQDPAAPQGWRGSGTGRALYRVTGIGPDWQFVHNGEPCNFVWDLTEIPAR